MLPKNEKTFHVEVVGERTKIKYEGDFTVKCVLTNWEDTDISLRSDRYNGGSATLPTGTIYLNRAMAELEVRILRNEQGQQMAPSWWRDSDNGRKLLDMNVVYQIFGQAIASEKEWLESIEKEAEAVQKATEEKAKKKAAKE